MKRILMALGLALFSLHSLASPQVGVSINVNQPGLYGRVDIGNVPAPPVLVYQQPMVIAQPDVIVERRPIYLHVPPHHSRHWRRHCGYYQACGQPVYFVREDWYRQHYYRGHDRGHWRERRVEERHYRHDHDRRRGHYRDHDNDRRHGHYRDRDHGHRGHGDGHGHGHGRRD